MNTKQIPLIAYLLLFISLSVFFSCHSDGGSSGTLKIRIAGEPDYIHPMLSKSPVSRQVERNIFLKLMDFDPVTLALTPMLAESQPSVERIDTGLYKGSVAYTYQIRKEAKWDNGSDVTSFDCLYALKAALLPDVNAKSWRDLLSHYKDILVDSSQPKKITMIVDGNYLLSDAIAGNFEVYPEYHYDPQHTLRAYSFTDLLHYNEKSKIASDSVKLRDYADKINGSVLGRDSIAGCGPYTLDRWEANKILVLKRKNNWWGDQIKNAPKVLSAYPGEIDFIVLPDDAASLAEFRSGNIDIMSGVPADQFETLKKEGRYQYFTPQVMQYFYIPINSKNPILADIKVRKALARLLDIDAIIKNLFKGYAKRITGPVMPDRPYYDQSLTPIGFDPSEARKLLSEAGWKDVNGDGILDGNVTGKTEPLKLKLITTQKKLGKDLALIFKDEAAKAGIDIEIESLEGAAFMKALKSGEYDLANLSNTQYPGENTDLTNNWNSENTPPKGSNFTGFGGKGSDDILTEINNTKDQHKRFELYKTFQKIVYDNQPAIFLFMPLERIVAQKKLDVVPTLLAPGYVESLIK